MNLTPEQVNAIDRMNEIAACWCAISNLIGPDIDISTQEARSDLAMLTGFLNREYAAAMGDLTNQKRLNSGGNHVR
jgi:hypothetical protein